MYRRGTSNPRGRGGNSSNAPQSSPYKPRQRGAFLEGSWHCDCDPRQPAERFRVKKDGKNHGRWFYTCQNSEGQRCGFFLWEDDAKPREEAAVLGNSRTEPGRTQDAARAKQGEKQFTALEDRAKGGGGQEAGEANPLWAAQQSKASNGGTGEKRKREAEVAELDGSETEGEDDELLPWPPTAEMEPYTPSKVAKTDAYATPKSGRKLPWLDYSNEEATPTKSAPVTAVKQESAQLPTPSQTKEMTRAESIPAPGETGYTPSKTLKEEVLAVLSSHMTLPDRVMAELVPVLNRHEMKHQGVIKGRELVRTALRTKDSKLVEMHGRIAGLEAEREVLLAAVGRARESAEMGL